MEERNKNFKKRKLQKRKEENENIKKEEKEN